MTNKPYYWEPDPSDKPAPPDEEYDLIGLPVAIKGSRQAGTIVRIQSDGRAVVDFGPRFWGDFNALSGEVIVSPDLLESPYTAERMARYSSLLSMPSKRE